MPALIEWLEPPDRDTGVDHLGMRVAGERAYNRLIDFTTTVTWRARYYSFLSWCLREAWNRTSADAPRDAKGQYGIDEKAWLTLLKRWDYALAASTLASEPRAERIGGRNKILPRLRAAEVEPLPFGTDHLETSAGSLGVYVGVMRLLDLSRNPDGIDRASPTRGEHLADAFEASLIASGKRELLDAEGADIDDLVTLGESCGFDQLARGALASPIIAAEQAVLRDTLFDWPAFNAGNGKTARRILSVGLILEIHRLLPNGATLDDFRALILLGRTHSTRPVTLSLPRLYATVLAEWRAYQVHANASFALEVLLEVFIAVAMEAQGERQYGLPLKRILSDMTTALVDGRTQVGDVDASLADLLARLGQAQTDGNDVLSEPEFAAQLTKRRERERPQIVYSAMLLFVGSVARVTSLGPQDWTGDNHRSRLPPATLAEHAEAGVRASLSVEAYFERVVADLVVRQHMSNALRKLAGDPSKYSVLFTIENERVFPLKSHQAFMSSPRFDNAVRMLRDLGLITQEGKALTDAGTTMLQQIHAVSA